MDGSLAAALPTTTAPPPPFSPGAVPAPSPPAAFDSPLHADASPAHFPLGKFTASLVPNSPHGLQGTGGRVKMPVGVVLSPGAAITPEPPMVKRAPVACVSCHAIINQFTRLDYHTNTWRCVFCGIDNTIDATYSVSADPLVLSFPEFESSVVDYVDPLSQPLLGSEQPGRVFAFVVDLTTPRQQLSALTDAIAASLPCLPQESKVALVTVGSVVCVHALDCAAYHARTVIPGQSAPSEGRELARVLAQASRYVCPTPAAAPVLVAALRQLAASADARAALRQDARRCAGAGVEVALALVAGAVLPPHTPSVFGAGEGDSPAPAARSTHQRAVPHGGFVFCFLFGAPASGPGSLQFSDDASHNAVLVEQALPYYQSLSSAAATHNIVIEVMCAGPHIFHLPVLQQLVLCNGGHVLLHPDFGAGVAGNIRHAVEGVLGRGARLTIQCSPTYLPSHILGQATLEPSRAASRRVCYVGSVVARTAHTVFFEPAEDFVADAVVFQFVFEFVTPSNCRTTRVATCRLGVTSSLPDLVGSVDECTLAVCVARKCVLAARKADVRPDTAHTLPHEAVDKHLMRVLAAGERRGPAVVPPAPLARLPRLMFLLRQGPLLGPVLQHADDKDYERCLFLHADLDTSVRLLRPRLYTAARLLAHADPASVHVSPDRPGDLFDELEPEDLALQSDAVLVFDHQTTLLVWSGRRAVGPAFDAVRAKCMEWVEAVARERFPTPKTMQFVEGSSMARWLQSRLIPSHKDPWAAQARFFPSIAALSNDRRRELVSKFHYTDDPSFYDYCQHLKIALF